MSELQRAPRSESLRDRSSIKSSDLALDGTYDGYCIDTDRTISQNTNYTAKIYSSYETLPNELTGTGNIEGCCWRLQS